MILQLAFESLAVITNALMKLEVGSVGVSRYVVTACLYKSSYFYAS